MPAIARDPVDGMIPLFAVPSSAIADMAREPEVVMGLASAAVPASAMADIARDPVEETGLATRTVPDIALPDIATLPDDVVAPHVRVRDPPDPTEKV
jgi:hypothetical protein